jgi:hypothetical protein
MLRIYKPINQSFKLEGVINNLRINQFQGKGRITEAFRYIQHSGLLSSGGSLCCCTRSCFKSYCSYDFKIGFRRLITILPFLAEN